MVIGDRHAPESESPVVGRLLFKPALRVETILIMIPPLFRLSCSALIGLLPLLIAGGLFTGWMVGRADRERRADLRPQSRLVARAVISGPAPRLPATEGNPHRSKTSETTPL